jgi:hypothetical protein
MAYSDLRFDHKTNLRRALKEVNRCLDPLLAFVLSFRWSPPLFLAGEDAHACGSGSHLSTTFPMRSAFTIALGSHKSPHLWAIMLTLVVSSRCVPRQPPQWIQYSWLTYLTDRSLAVLGLV